MSKEKDIVSTVVVLILTGIVFIAIGICVLLHNAHVQLQESVIRCHPEVFEEGEYYADNIMIYKLENEVKKQEQEKEEE